MKASTLTRRRRTARAPIALALFAGLVGCGSTQSAGVLATVAPSVPESCSTAVLATLSSVLRRVYREGVASERTGSAKHLITHSKALRTAVETGNRAAALAAARALLATGHMTDLLITRDAQPSRPFISLGGAAIAPLRGTLTGPRGAPIASYVTSVWADRGFLSEAGGVTQGLVMLRAGETWVGASGRGSPALTAGALANEGALTIDHIAYRYTSFPTQSYPSGAERVYMLIPLNTIAGRCGQSSQDTTVNTLEHVAKLIYTGELGRSAHNQVRRVQRNGALLQAVANRDPEAARLSIDALLNQYIVRIRVTVGGELLSDVGGPYVLAPVRAPLKLHGRAIGGLVLSIQDDEGYLRLARRLAGLDVLMYMNVEGVHQKLVKDSLGPMPGPAPNAVPAAGPFRYRGRDFRVFTVHARAFPSGPLTIRVLVPLPYR